MCNLGGELVYTSLVYTLECVIKRMVINHVEKWLFVYVKVDLMMRDVVECERRKVCFLKKGGEIGQLLDANM